MTSNFVAVQFGLAKGVKAGWLYLYPPLDASPPLPFSSYDMRGPDNCVQTFNVLLVVLIFRFLDHFTSSPFDSFLCCRSVNTRHSEPAQYHLRAAGIL